ncbi:MAG: diacylglycerol kinase family lipid kinase [Planctomycetes bacterium]|nr:diacylglycerol kinase family lipid kinase [Planctomycetota bacterium]MCW8134301.1 diacylglycerol kinase family lipid kinase [Planctomycetota bacterium]
MRRLLAIANPISGRGHALRLVPRIERLAGAAGVEISIQLTERAGHGRELAAAAAGQGFNAVMAVGGDGTINEVINGLGPHGLPLLVVPQGTGNVLAKELKATRKLDRYVKPLKAWHTRKRDLGRLDNGRLFACFVGAGFDGQCTRAFAERKGSIRMVQYVPIMWNAIRHSDFTSIVVKPGDAHAREPASYALVSITPEYGGPLALTGKAKPDDGRFDVLTVHERITPLSLVKLVGYAFSRRMGRVSSARFVRCSSVAIEATEEVPIQVDGDFAGYLPVQAEILPGALSYFEP